MKICWQDITDGQRLGSEYYGYVEKLLKRVARPDTNITIRHLRKNPKKHTGEFIEYEYFEYLNNWEVLEGVIQAEREGYDAVMLNCMADPVLREARESVDIPVCAAAESSYLVACMLGQRFAVITTKRKYVPGIELNLISYGLERRAISKNPVRFVEHHLEFYTLPWKKEELLEAFEKVAKECVDDGAEVIVPGCTVISTFLTTNNYTKIEGTGAIVLDNFAAEVKMTEALVDLKKSLGVFISRANLYASIKNVPKDIREDIRHACGLS